MRKLNIAIITALVVALALSAFVLVYSAVVTPPVNTGHSADSVDISGGWSDGGGNRYSFPISKGTFAAGERVTLTRILPGNLPEDPAFFLYSKRVPLEITLDGRRLEVDGTTRKTAFNEDYTGRWIKAELNGVTEDSVLEITFTAPANGGANFDCVRIYNLNSLTTELLRGNIPIMLLSIVLLVLGVCMLAAAFFIRRRMVGVSFVSVVSIAAFSMLSALWLITDCNVMRLFAGFGDFQFYLSYLSFMLLAPPILLFTRELVSYGRKMLSAYTLLSLGVFLALVSLAVLGVTELKSTLFIMHLTMIGGILLITFIVICDYIQNHNRVLPYLCASYAVIGVFVGIAMGKYYSGDYDYSIYYAAGIAVFTAILSCGAFIRISRLVGRASAFSSITTSIPSGICMSRYGDGLYITYANDFCYRLLGYEPGEVDIIDMGSIEPLISAAECERITREVNEAIERGDTTSETEVCARHKSGREIWLLVRSTYSKSRGEIISSVIDITDRVKYENRLRSKEEEYRIATQHSEKYIVRYDITSRTLYVQSGAAALFGVDKQLPGVPESFIEHGLVVQESAADFDDMFTRIIRGDPDGSALIHLNCVGRSAWYHFDFTNVSAPGSENPQAVITFYDITEQREMEFFYTRWRQSVADMPHELISVIEFNITKDTFTSSEGGLFPETQGMPSMTLDKLAERLSERSVGLAWGDRFRALCSREYLLERFGDGTHELALDYELRGAAGRWVRSTFQMAAYKNGDVKLIIISRDITDFKAEEITLRERSTTDPLTGVLNRAAIKEGIEAISGRVVGARHAFVMLDVDNFKGINDSRGHAFGDKVLIHITSELSSMLRDGDLFGRLGGDEFIFCMKNISGEEALLQRISRISERLCCEYDGLRVSVSMGIAFFGGEAQSFARLYERADIALYEAKARGKNTFVVYSPELKAKNNNPES